MIAAEDARRLHSSTLADVLDTFGVWGVLPPELLRLSGGDGPFFGRAYTVQWGWTRKMEDIRQPQKPTWDQVKAFLAPDVNDGRGLVYVGGTNCGYMRSMALAGGMSATHFASIGFEGVVLGGAIRDAHVVRSLAMPVVATNFIPADTQGCFQVLEAGTECSVGDLRVRSGDWVFVDGSGGVVVPAAIAADVVRKALSVEKVEAAMEERLRAKESLSQIVDESGRI